MIVKGVLGRPRPILHRPPRRPTPLGFLRFVTPKVLRAPARPDPGPHAARAAGVCEAKGEEGRRRTRRVAGGRGGPLILFRTRGNGRAAPGVSCRMTRQRLLGLLTVTLLVAAGSLVFATHHISAVAEPYVESRVADLPSVRVGLVLGCAERTRDGRRNLFFERRIAAAVELFRAGRVQYLLLSGDNSTPDYDEPSDMRRALVQAGIPAARLVLDHAGFRTLDSVVRAKEVFGLSEVIVVSQHFHNERAVYLARSHGIEAYAFDAQAVGGREGTWMAAREALSRLCAILDVRLLHTAPRFLGRREAVPF